MSKDKYFIAIILAILAAALYAISTPVSKVMLQTVAPTMVAAFIGCPIFEKHYKLSLKSRFAECQLCQQDGRN